MYKRKQNCTNRIMDHVYYLFQLIKIKVCLDKEKLAIIEQDTMFEST